CLKKLILLQSKINFRTTHKSGSRILYTFNNNSPDLQWRKDEAPSFLPQGESQGGVKKLSPTSLRGIIIQTLSPSLGRGRGVGIKKQNPLRMKRDYSNSGNRRKFKSVKVSDQRFFTSSSLSIL
ncbi:MAG: hypothetical protein J6U36_05275, partial [Oscillospiraceae bacterium]|nr:hypothetical protein [Oscillospiraceae bacterium]